MAAAVGRVVAHQEAVLRVVDGRGAKMVIPRAAPVAVVVDHPVMVIVVRTLSRILTG